MHRVSKPVFFVLGSTGSGKSKVAVHLAQELQKTRGYTSVVVVNCDVYQCFSDLPIATNKPCVADLGNVTHVCFGFLSSDGVVLDDDVHYCPEQRELRQQARKELSGGAVFNVHAYERIATGFITSFFERHTNAAVVVCGGTCYYAQSLLFTHSLVYDCGTAAPNAKPANGEAADDMWERLHAVDAQVALRYHPNDHRRIKRLLDIYDATGEVPSSIFDAQAPQLRFDGSSVFIVWVRVEREALDRSLDDRVEQMMLRGMLDEVESFWLEHRGHLPENSLSDAIGCKEFTQFFSGDKPPLISCADRETAVAQIKSSTRRYARQQERWIQNRLIPLLYTSALQQHANQFAILWAGSGVDTLSSVREVVSVFFDPSPTPPLEEKCFPLAQPLVAREPVCQERCTICEALVYGRGQMEVHLKSKRHRAFVKRLALEREQRERYGRELPPPKRRRDS
ncbi:Isopentenyl transferase/IPP transferase/Zinc-finger of C2H2 type [Novymonas esmeraldas]|uniref:Isopentenyl transferase/IPP transferase/Zinc-finger of C2H2 type n=1 Tax=Novymonas esmeraldas TaxID=1808958 RepID=A0AAW0F2G1_9TRYP